MKAHRARILAMQALFQLEFQKRDQKSLFSFDWIDYKVPRDEMDFAVKLVKGVVENSEHIDKVIEKHLINWEFSRVSPVNRSILRLSIYQILYLAEEIPMKVLIDEAIKLALKYSEADSSRFINGILDAIAKKETE